MFRFACALAVSVCAATVSAQEWADKLFPNKDIDFGAVPRSARVEHEFVVTNPFKEDLHIAAVRSSCGCTAPRIEGDTLKSFQQGKVIAAFNTDAFTGHHSATVTVTIDRPQWAEVRLHVRGYVRTDVVLNPKEVNFGSIGVGEAAEKKIQIRYAGRGDWQITGAKTDSPYLTASVNELAREGGQVRYELDVKLADNAPTGYLNDRITLLTTDSRGEFPVVVEGRIVPQLSVSPATLPLGTVQPGQKITRQIVVKGAKPFKIVDIQSDNDAFHVTPTAATKAVHLLPLTFEASNTPGKFTAKLEIITDLEGQKSVTLTATGEVTAAVASN